MRTWRMFVSCPIEAGGASRWASLAAPHLPPGARATLVEQMHVTVLFIGPVREREVEGLGESVSRAAAGLEPVMLTPRRLVTRPTGGPARVLALETDGPPALLELHRRLVTRLARVKPGRGGSAEGFWPHVTLARLDLTRANAPVDEAAAWEAVPIDRVRLVRSVLRPAGAEHRTVLEVALNA